MTEESSLNHVISRPLISPQVVATARHSRMASGMGEPALNVTAMITADRATVDATEMSMKPRMMTMVIGRTRNALSRKVMGVLTKVPTLRK